ncbi:dUTP diphosphatase [candidate division KSB1 bacterium]|nr:dUTP diphosphatase [candidate division KSB1 bacterium]
MQKVQIKIQIEPGCEDLSLPKYQTEHASGMDLIAAVTQPVTLEPGDYQLIPTGIRIELPIGYEAQVRPRSGLAIKSGIGVLNSPGTIDADYRGNVGVILINHSKESFIIHRGDRIAQLVIQPVLKAEFKIENKLEQTKRNSGGFGSTDQ